MTKLDELKKLFLSKKEEDTGWIEADNLDEIKLVRKSKTEIVVENEHGTEFPMSELSEAEINVFLFDLKN